MGLFELFGLTLDESSIIGGLIGSILGIIGSIIVAMIYILNQNKLEKNKRINEQIQKTYVEKRVFFLYKKPFKNTQLIQCLLSWIIKNIL